ncbi:MAG: UPF0175 family protein [Hormoscilla sp. GM7CHS1pb]|nr:UPF0175 family protein [Hormoscilla sp. GM7CHS1pb]
MSVIIPDETLRATEMTEAEFKLEIAVLLFDARKITLGHASFLAEIDKKDFRQVLKSRNIPLYHYDIEDYEHDIKTLRKLGRL